MSKNKLVISSNPILENIFSQEKLFINAILRKNYIILAKLLKLGFPSEYVFNQDSQFATGLLYALNINDLKMVELFLEHGASIKTQVNQKNAFYYILKHDNLKLFKKFHNNFSNYCTFEYIAECGFFCFDILEYCLSKEIFDIQIDTLSLPAFMLFIEQLLKEKSLKSKKILKKIYKNHKDSFIGALLKAFSNDTCPFALKFAIDEGIINKNFCFVDIEEVQIGFLQNERILGKHVAIYIISQNNNILLEQIFKINNFEESFIQYLQTHQQEYILSLKYSHGIKYITKYCSLEKMAHEYKIEKKNDLFEPKKFKIFLILCLIKNNIFSNSEEIIQNIYNQDNKYFDINDFKQALIDITQSLIFNAQGDITEDTVETKINTLISLWERAGIKKIANFKLATLKTLL